MNLKTAFATLALAVVASFSLQAHAQETSGTVVYDENGTVVTTQPADDADTATTNDVAE